MQRVLLVWLWVLSAVLAACAPSGSAGPQEITLDATLMKYEPATIEVTAGRPVRLVFRNQDTVEHDFSIVEIPTEMKGPTQEPMAGHDMGQMAEEPELHVAALMNESATLEFTPTKPGTYEFFCTVAGHKEAGMIGTLVVKAP